MKVSLRSRARGLPFVSRSLCAASLPALALIAGLAGGSPRAAAEESWAMGVIRGELQSRAEEEGRGRVRQARAVERETIFDDDDDRPQRRSSRSRAARPRVAQRHVRVASLGRELTAPPASVAKAAPVVPPAQSAAQPPAGAGDVSGRAVTSIGRGEEIVVSPAPAPQRHRKPGAVVASLGRELVAPQPSAQPSLSGGGRVNWTASAGCLASSLRSVIASIATNFGPVRVNSTCRSRRHNARVGGARRSYHLTGNAVDFRIGGHIRQVYAFLRGTRSVGGLKHYGGGLFHIDTGPRRSW